MRRWPDCLPTPSFPGFGLSPFDKTNRTDMEVGLARVRQTTFANADLVKMMWIMADDQMGAFRAFCDDAPVSLAGDSDDLTGWTLLGTTLSLAGAAGPDESGPTALTETGATSQHRISKTLPGLNVSGRDVVIHAAIAAAGRDFARISLVDRSGALRSATLDLTDGSVTVGAGVSAEVVDRGRGFWRIRMVANTGTGADVPQLRLLAMPDADTVSYPGDGTSGIRICEVSVAEAGDWNLFVRSGADGRALGAAGGAAWIVVPLAVGGGLAFVEARFKGVFDAQGGKGLSWTVTATLEARYA